MKEAIPFTSSGSFVSLLILGFLAAGCGSDVEPASAPEIETPGNLSGPGSISGTFLIDGVDGGEGPYSWLGWPDRPEIRAQHLDLPGSETGVATWSPGPGELRFQLADLDPGTYLLDVAWGLSEPLPISIEEIVVEAGGRVVLEPVDFREWFRGIEIEVVDHEGQPVEAARVHHHRTDEEGATGTRTVIGSPEGRAAIIADIWGVDLTVSADGHRSAWLTEVTEDTRVVLELEEQIRVKLVLEQPVTLEDPAHELYFALDPVDDDPVRKTLSDFRSRTGHLRFEGEAVELELEGPGPWHVTWGIAHRKGGRFSLVWATGSDDPPRIEVLESAEHQVFDIPPPSPETIQKLIEGLERR